MLWIVGSAILLDGVFFNVLPPLLPQLARGLDLSKTAGGALAGCYALGAVLSVIPGFLFVARRGPRAGLLLGTAVFALASAAFALASSAPPLFAARLAQGVGCSLTWTAGLSWVTAQAPPAQRGARIGVVESTSVAGALLGPVVGASAGALGRAPVFLAAAALSCALAAALSLFPAPTLGDAVGIADLRLLVRRPAALGAMWMLTLASLLVGLLSVLAPLQLAVDGLGSAAIGAVFLLAAIVQITLNPLIGRWSDRDRRHATMLVPLSASALTIGLLALAGGRWALAALTCAAAISAGLMWTPAMASVSAEAERGGLSLTAAAATIGVAWPPGLLAGTAGGGAIADAVGDRSAFGGGAALCLATIALLLLCARQRARRPSSSRSQ